MEKKKTTKEKSAKAVLKEVKKETTEVPKPEFLTVTEFASKLEKMKDSIINSKSEDAAVEIVNNILKDHNGIIDKGVIKVMIGEMRKK